MCAINDCRNGCGHGGKSEHSYIAECTGYYGGHASWRRGGNCGNDDYYRDRYRSMPSWHDSGWRHTSNNRHHASR
jgi:hypothetical protein